MTTYPADAVEAALKAQALALDRGADGETAFLAALAAFDAAMLAHGWKRVRVYTQADLDAAEREAEHLLAVFETDATPEVKP